MSRCPSASDGINWGHPGHSHSSAVKGGGPQNLEEPSMHLAERTKLDPKATYYPDVLDVSPVGLGNGRSRRARPGAEARVTAEGNERECGGDGTVLHSDCAGRARATKPENCAPHTVNFPV